MRLIAGLLALGLSCAISDGAQAATLIATFQGTIYSGYDESDFFQTGNTSLAGASYTAVYRFNTAIGNVTDDGNLLQIWGGSSVGAPSPGLGMTLTIGGKSMELDGQYQAQVASGLLNLGVPALGFAVSYGEVINNGFYYKSTSSYEHIATLSGLIPSSLKESFQYQINPEDQVFGGIDILEVDRDLGTRLNFVWASFSPTHLSVSVSNSGAVPEPSNWALMIVGFGLCGSALRIGSKSGKRIYQWS